MASANAGVLGVTAIKPPEYHGWEAVKMFFYDSEKGEYMGRTGKSWALIILFYIILNLVLVYFLNFLFVKECNHSQMVSMVIALNVQDWIK